MDQPVQHPAPPHPRPANMPFTGHRSALIRRTLATTVALSALVTASAASMGWVVWGWWFAAAAIWALVFLGLTPLILRMMLFERRPLAGLLLMGIKLVWLGLMVLALMGGPGDALGSRAQLAAVIAGMTTPLAVVALWAMLGRTAAVKPPAAMPREHMERHG
jgi:hypothetical protein